MRIWDIKPEYLCRNHLLGEHRELHAIWSIITREKKGYSNHPEVNRWRGKLKALFLRHKLLVKEMENRRYKHKSPLKIIFAIGNNKQDLFIDPPKKQKIILLKKGCSCLLSKL